MTLAVAEALNPNTPEPNLNLNLIMIEKRKERKRENRNSDVNAPMASDALYGRDWALLTSQSHYQFWVFE